MTIASAPSSLPDAAVPLARASPPRTQRPAKRGTEGRPSVPPRGGWVPLADGTSRARYLPEPDPSRYRAAKELAARRYLSVTLAQLGPRVPTLSSLGSSSWRSALYAVQRCSTWLTESDGVAMMPSARTSESLGPARR
jgi:hypothetical protein